MRAAFFIRKRISSDLKVWMLDFTLKCHCAISFNDALRCEQKCQNYRRLPQPSQRHIHTANTLHGACDLSTHIIPTSYKSYSHSKLHFTNILSYVQWRFSCPGGVPLLHCTHWTKSKMEEGAQRWLLCLVSSRQCRLFAIHWIQEKLTSDHQNFNLPYF